MLRKALIVVIFIWFVISVLRLMLNIYQMFAYDFQDFTASDDATREKNYGYVYDKILKIKDLSDANSTIGIVSTNGKNFYLARYYLYPRKVVWVKTIEEIKNNKPDFLLLYEFDSKFSNLIQNKNKNKAYILKN